MNRRGKKIRLRKSVLFAVFSPKDGFRGKDLSLLASEYLNTKQVSTMYFPIFWRHFISKIVIRDTYWKKWGVFSTKIEF